MRSFFNDYVDEILLKVIKNAVTISIEQIIVTAIILAAFLYQKTEFVPKLKIHFLNLILV